MTKPAPWHEDLPDGLKKLTSVEEVQAAWGDLFTVPIGDDEEDREVLFAGNSKIAITTDAVFIKLRKPVHAGENKELTNVLRIVEPTVNDVRQADKCKSEFEKSICLMTLLCGILAADAGKMPMSDANLFGEVIQAFS